MLKRFSVTTVMVAILLAPALAFSAAKLAPGEAVVGSDNTVTIPLDVSTSYDVLAMDIPLKFSEGATLKEVSFENTRVDFFDLKIAKIMNDQNIVVIGLVNQITPEAKPLMEAGSGPVAYLVFELEEGVSEITLEATELENPHHRLVYITRDEGKPPYKPDDQPQFDRVTKPISESIIPGEFALKQNYPNPFNPTTQIQFDVPVASKVQLTVYNVLGQKVTTLVNEFKQAGAHTVTWNSTNSDGQSVSSGVYFYRVVADNFVKTRKMMLLK